MPNRCNVEARPISDAKQKKRASSKTTRHLPINPRSSSETRTRRTHTAAQRDHGDIMSTAGSATPVKNLVFDQCGFWSKTSQNIMSTAGSATAALARSTTTRAARWWGRAGGRAAGTWCSATAETARRRPATPAPPPGSSSPARRRAGT